MLPSHPTAPTIIRPVTLIESARLNERLGLPVILASETFQQTGSFKFRAAYHVATSVPHPRILTASSGNFGQAMALACRLTGKSCTVVMPANSAQVKIQAVRSYGGEIDLIDTQTISRSTRVAELAKIFPDAYVASAYDDPLVIEGNASLGTELSHLGHLFDILIAPVGGGGLTSGLLQGLAHRPHRPAVFGAEPLLANDAARSWRAGSIQTNLSEPQTLADGARTVSLGQHNWAILKTGLSGIIEVSEDHIAEAVKLLFELANLKAEPTGALSLAALLEQPERFRGQTVSCVISGGNVDPTLFCELLGNRMKT